MPRQVDKERESRRKRAKATNWVNMSFHKQSRTLKAALHTEGQNEHPHVSWRDFRVYANMHTYICKQTQECAITRFITPAHINVDTHIPIGTIIVLT